MTPKQALDFLMQLSATSAAPLATHMQAQNAYKVISNALPQMTSVEKAANQKPAPLKAVKKGK